MANEKLTTQSEPPGFKVVSIKLSDEIRNDVKAAAITTGLKPVDVMRLALQRGIGIVVDQLTTTTNTSEEASDS